MSTILDALRKVQKERQPRDLQESVTLAPEGPRETRRWPRLLLRLVVLASIGAGAGWLWQSPQGAELRQTYLASQDDDVAAETAAIAPASQPAQLSKQAKLRREERARKLKRAAAARRQVQEAQLQVAATAPAAETRPPTTPAAVVGTPAEAREPAAPVKVVSKPGRPRHAPAPSGPTLARPRTAADPAQPTTASPDAKPELVARVPVPRPQIDLAMRLEPIAKSAEDRKAEIFLAGGGALTLPELSIERVSWHPKAERRSARIRLDGTRPIEAREGDIIAGVAIERIDPGAVEVRMGDALWLIQLGQ